MTTPDPLQEDIADVLRIVRKVSGANARNLVIPGDPCEVQARYVVFGMLRQRGYSFGQIAKAFEVSKGCVSSAAIRIVQSQYGMRIFQQAQEIQGLP